jgi:hypothetical protein
MQQHADEYDKDAPINHIILVGRNASVFNIPFLLHQMCEHRIADRFFQDSRFGFGINTLNVARKGICDDKSGVGVPTAYNLPTFFQFFGRIAPDRISTGIGCPGVMTILSHELVV